MSRRSFGLVSFLSIIFVGALRFCLGMGVQPLLSRVSWSLGPILDLDLGSWAKTKIFQVILICPESHFSLNFTLVCF